MTVEPFVSYSQNGEDVILWRALGHVRDGRYVDVGAADPELDSVSKTFVDRGWRGIDIEPEPHLARRLREARPDNEIVEAAVTDEPVDHVLLQTSEVRVPAITLDDVFTASALLLGDIHFLKVAVNGVQGAVLRSMSLEKWRPWVIVVKAAVLDSAVPSREAWEQWLTGSGYTFTLFDGVNHYYVSPDHPELTKQLSYPACVLDHFTKAEYVRLARDLSEARAEISRWRNMAIGGFAESTSVAQDARARMVNLKKRVRKLDETLEVTREKLFAVRRTNRSLKTELDRLGSHIEVRMRKRVAKIRRRARGKP